MADILYHFDELGGGLVDDKKDSADFSGGGPDDGDRLARRAAPRKVMTPNRPRRYHRISPSGVTESALSASPCGVTEVNPLGLPLSVITRSLLVVVLTAIRPETPIPNPGRALTILPGDSTRRP